jgi:ubiquinone/menaquinone biosynthesis C-methylase UbiE
MCSPETFDQKQQRFWAVNTNVRSYDHPVVRAFAMQRIQFIQRLLCGWRPAEALEVGCGDGFGMQYMRTIVERIHGCDSSPAMLDANQMDKQVLTMANAYALPFDNRAFELVYCWELLHHVGRPSDAVCEMKRVSRKCVLLCEPNCLNPAMAAFGLIRPEERGLLRFTPRYTKILLVDAGLCNVRLASVGCFTPNRTPAWLANLFMKLPYRWPVIGMYNIAIGYI